MRRTTSWIIRLLHVTGRLPKDYPDGALLKTDTFGNIIWKKKIDLPTNGMNSVPANDGGFFLALPDETSPQVRRFAKLDADGNIVWAKRATAPGSASSFWLSGLGDAAVFVAFNSTNADIERCYLLKINNAGDVLVNKVIDFAELGRFTMAVPAQNGGFWLIGFTHSFQKNAGMVALLFDSMGNIVLNRLHRLTDGRRFQNGSAVPTDDGGYAVCCSVYDNPSQATPNHDAFVWRADAAGTILWAKRIWVPTNDNIESSANLFQSSDGDFHCRYSNYQNFNAHLVLGPDGNVKLFDRLVVEGDSLIMPEQFFEVGNRMWMSARQWNVFNRIYLLELDTQGKPDRCGETIPLPSDAVQPGLIPDTLIYTIVLQTIAISPTTLTELPHTETLVPLEHCVTEVDCPEICFNKLDDDEDGLIDCADPDCVCLPDAVVEAVQVSCLPDSLELRVRICNRSAYPLPAGIPVAVYAGDPRLVAAMPLGNPTYTAEPLGQDTCLDLFIRIPTVLNQAVFVALNDDRSQQTPYAVPPATAQEADYNNNFTSFVWSYQAPTLELGADRETCESSVQILTAGAGFATYRWHDNSPDSVFTAFQPGVYWVDVWDVCGSHQTDTVRISIQPTNSFDLGPDRTICPGATLHFSLPATLHALWEPATGLDCPTCTSVTASPQQSVTYHVTAALGDCFISDSVRIAVTGQAPLANFTFVVQPDSSVQFTDVSQFAEQWRWDFGDGTFSDENNPVHTYQNEGEYLVTLRVWNTCDTVETTRTISWFFPPLAGFSVPDTVRGCEAVVLVFENGSSANAITYTWSFPGGTPDQSNEQNPAVTYTQTGDYSAMLVSGNNQGTDTLTKTFRVEIESLPLANFTFVVQPDSSVQFTDASQFAEHWFWDFGDGTFSSETNPAHTFQNEGEYLVTLRVWNTCDTVQTTRTISWFFPPLAGFSVPDTVRGCEAVVLVFENGSSANSITYTWSFPGGTPDQSNEKNPAVTYTQTGDYSAVLVAGNNQGTDTLTKTFRVEIESFPVANFTMDIQPDGKVQFNNSSQFAQHTLWDFGDGTFSDETNPVHTYTKAGEYIVSLTISNFCGAAVMQQTIKPALTNAIAPTPGSISRVHIYPNPATDALWVDVAQVQGILLNIQVLDTKGRLFTTTPAGQNTLYHISVADLPAGILFVRTQFDKGVYVHKVVRR